ncbi:hypothetical protein VCUG_02098 [Vavraia culicis subsp. floridensis]|uniref:Uncharacterized protein n=1 Tax=Vavraia culicis (isolate floridensis) TaxID=948595 RepID=L2GTK8_VAVCU|nr:uncharacterized protein VCUG_02098 [Vavraia culicis subsp. floridensis]ELA46420.1 hypothetical protein VCUG_02098 [Vavraia culicis subsp. floridensis]
MRYNPGKTMLPAVGMKGVLRSAYFGLVPKAFSPVVHDPNDDRFPPQNVPLPVKYVKYGLFNQIAGERPKLKRWVHLTNGLQRWSSLEVKRALAPAVTVRPPTAKRATPR